jgi:hypothetical protein
LAAAGVSWFAITVAALHLLPTGLNPVQRTISEYVNQPYGWLVPVAGLGLGAGSLALCLALHRALPPPRPRAGVVLLAVWGMAMLVVAVFPADPAPPGRPVHFTAAGVVHVVAGVVAFAAFAVAAPLLSRAIPWRPIKVLGIMAPLSLALFVITTFNRPRVSRLIGQPNAWGLGERIMVAVYVAWLLCAAAWTVRATAGRGRSSGSAGTP